LYVPASAGRGSPVPLIVMLHGSGRVGMSLVEKWKDLAKKENFIIAGPDSTNTQFWRMPEDGPDYLHDLVEELKKNHPERLVQVVIGEGMSATGDPRLLRIVMENLIGNSWKFTQYRSDARIELGMGASEEGKAFYFVKDNGAGFDMAYADKLFGAFQRLHRESEFEGTGIGLATVARIVQRHGGKIWAKGVPDRGATFFFTLKEEA
jgi:light-regulated signal transduction histidine kinase (bacteriophytochrome)